MAVTILLFLALVLFLLAAFGRKIGHVDAGWLGLASLALAMLWPTLAG